MTETIISEKEVWRPVAGWAKFYEVSDEGRVRSLPRHARKGIGRYARPGKILCPRDVGDGYLKVTFYHNGEVDDCYIHHLVLEAFVGSRPKGMECRHLNGIKTYNHASNLRWSTHRENEADKTRHGTLTRGERCGTSKLTELDVRCIKHWLRNGRWSQRKIAEAFGVCQQEISRINTGKRWGWLALEG